MSAYYVIRRNYKAGYSVRVDIKRREIVEAGERFIRHTIERDCGFDTPCLIWTASPRFYVSDELTTTPRRFIMIYAGCEIEDSVKVKTICRTPNCVSFGHLKW